MEMKYSFIPQIVMMEKEGWISGIVLLKMEINLNDLRIQND